MKRRLQGNLFPDRREPEGSLIDAGDALALLSTQSQAAPAIEALRAIDWAHPALFVYREAQDDRWSHVWFGLSLREGYSFADGD